MDRGGVLHRPGRVPPRLEPRADRGRRLAHPATNHVEHVPAVIGQDAAARERGIEPPVAALPVAHGRRLRPQCLPDHTAYFADGALGEQLGRPLDDRRVVPVVDGVQDAPAVTGESRERRQLFGRDHERLLDDGACARGRRGWPAACRCRRNPASRERAGPGRWRATGPVGSASRWPLVVPARGRWPRRSRRPAAASTPADGPRARRCRAR